MIRFLILVAVAFVVVSATCVWLLWTYLPAAPPTYIFQYGWTPVLKLVAVVILVLTGLGVAGGLKGNVARVKATAIANVVLGALGTIYGELNTHFGMLIDDLITFELLAPLRAASIAMLAFGLFGALLVLGAFQLRGRRDG